MAIKIEKKILESFIEKLVENRTEDPHYKTFEEDPEEEIPIEASAHMSTQLSVEAPPVDDPDYMPGTKKELGRAADLIANEVPEDQIEKYYRSMHKLLNVAIDSHDDKKFSDELLEQKFRMLIREADKDEEERLKRIGSQSVSLPGEDTVGSAISRMMVSDEEKRQRDIATEKMRAMTRPRSKKDPFAGVPDGPAVNTSHQVNKRLAEYEKAFNVVRQGEMPESIKQEMTAEDIAFLERLVKEISEQELTSAIVDNSLEDVKVYSQYTDVYHLAAAGVLEVNFMGLMALQGGRFGGTRIATPEQAAKDGTPIIEIPPGAEGSRSHDKSIAEDIKTRYGLDVKYGELLTVQSMQGMVFSEIVRKIGGIVKGLHDNSKLFRDYTKEHTKYVKSCKTDAESLEMISMIISQLYSDEAEIKGFEETDYELIVAQYFGRARGKLTYTEDLHPMHNPQKPMVKPVQSNKVLRKILRSELVSDQQKKDIKSQMRDFIILNVVLNHKNKKQGGYSIKHPRIPGVRINIPEEEKDSFIKDLDERIALEFMQMEIDDPDVDDVLSDVDKEMEAEQLLKDAQNQEYRKMIAELEKRADPTSLTHIAPLMGYSGANGLRQWMNKFPERKMNILNQYFRRDEKDEGLGAFAKYYNSAIENMSLQWKIALKLYLDVLNGVYGDDITFGETTKPGLEVEGQEEKERELIEETLANLEIISDATGDLDPFEMRDILQKYESDQNNLTMYNDPYRSDYEPDVSFEDYDLSKAKAYHDAMYTFAGFLLREYINIVPEDIVRKVQKPWEQAVKDNLINNYNISSDLAEKFKQHFTGAKNIPNFEQMKSTARKFANAGMSASDFFKAYDQGIEFLDQQLVKLLVKDEYQQAMKKKLEAAGKKVPRDLPTKYGEKKVVPVIKMDMQDVLEKALIPGRVKSSEQKAAIKHMDELFDFVRVAIEKWNEMAGIRNQMRDAQIALDLERQKLDEIRFISDYIESLLL